MEGRVATSYAPFAFCYLAGMSTAEELFSKPYNWCDRRCERCPLHDRCQLVLREKQLRWQDEARGIDPDAPGREWVHLATELERALKLAEDAAREEGIDLDAPVPPQVVDLKAERLQRAAMRVVVCLKIEDHDDVARIDALHEAVMLTMKLTAKLARVGGYMREGSGVWSFDGEPNLLLVEHVAADLRRELERLQLAPDSPVAAPALMLPARAQAQAKARALAGAQAQAAAALEALDALDALLAPLLADLSAAARTELAALIDAGEAPSPFCVRDVPAATA